MNYDQKRQALTSPLMMRRDYDDSPEPQESSMFKVVPPMGPTQSGPLEDYDKAIVIMGPAGPIGIQHMDGTGPHGMGDGPGEGQGCGHACPTCGRSGPMMKFARCIDPNFDKIKKVVKGSDLSSSDKGLILDNLDKIYKKYVELEKKVD